MEADKIIFTYKQNCNKLVVKWLEDYFDAEYSDYTWIDTGNIFQFADHYISMSTILECYKHKVSKEDFFNWYDAALEQQTDLSLAEFVILPAKREEARVKYLEGLKLRVEPAEKELKQAIDEYNQ
jgi:hypothetical protein